MPNFIFGRAALLSTSVYQVNEFPLNKSDSELRRGLEGIYNSNPYLPQIYLNALWQFAFKTSKLDYRVGCQVAGYLLLAPNCEFAQVTVLLLLLSLLFQSLHVCMWN